MSESHTLPLLALATTVVIWSVTPNLVRSFAQEVGAADAIVIRMWTNALSALPFLLWVGPRVDWADVKIFALIGIVGNFGYYIGSNYGFANLNAGTGGMIYATNPLFIAALSVAVGVERLNYGVIAGLVISFIGTIYLFADGLGKANAHPLFGGLMMLAGCAAWAVYVVYAKRLIGKYGPVKVTLWSTTLCALPALSFASATTIPAVLHLSHGAVYSLLALCFIGTLMSVMLWNYAAGKLPPTGVGASLFLIPPCIALFGWLFFGEATDPKTLVAGLIILAGVGVAEFGKSFRVARA